VNNAESKSGKRDAAKKGVAAVVANTLASIRVEDGQTNYFDLAMRGGEMEGALAANSSGQLSEREAAMLFADRLFSMLNYGDERLRQPRKGTCTLAEHLGSSLDGFVSDLVDYVFSLPRPYELLVPLPPGLPVVADTELAPSLSLVFRDDVDGVDTTAPLGLLAGKRTPNAFLRFHFSGFCTSDLENELVQRAVAHTKLVLQPLVADALATERTFHIEASFGAFFDRDHRIRRLGVSWTDLLDPRWKGFADLSIDLSRYLASLRFSGAAGKPAVDGPEREYASHVLDSIALVGRLIACTSDDCERVKAAMEWCVDSYTTQNQTIRFLQVCMGLEAALGDERVRERLTQTLADRCAYLIARSAKERQTVGKLFRDIYSTRSDIVHGRARALSKPQRAQLGNATKLLEKVIRREFGYLQLD
jgi:hypothetical protein